MHNEIWRRLSSLDPLFSWLLMQPFDWKSRVKQATIPNPNNTRWMVRGIQLQPILPIWKNLRWTFWTNLKWHLFLCHQGLICTFQAKLRLPVSAHPISNLDTISWKRAIELPNTYSCGPPWICWLYVWLFLCAPYTSDHLGEKQFPCSDNSSKFLVQSRKRAHQEAPNP